MSDKIKFTIYGQPYSKANSRRLVMIKGKPRFIKSKQALNYSKDFLLQCPKQKTLIPKCQDVSVSIKIYYSSRRPDLDESLILDLMQDIIYENDRSVKEKHITWGLDKENPRAEVEVSVI
jgi:Holliday junction resolvase RusA-like endonuclease|tara:strand:- start:2568 stop:2927 length:360 start_codon:yes stop_codon:yes gene_type:complete